VSTCYFKDLTKVRENINSKVIDIENWFKRTLTILSNTVYYKSAYMK